MLTTLRFEAPDGSLSVSVPAKCVDRWRQFRQTRFWHRESGGLMFAPSIGSADGYVEITIVSGPYPTDRATRYSLRLDHQLYLADIASYFKEGLHFVGYWHTHPDRSPALSGIDRRALARNLREGGLAIERLIAVVVGNGTSDSSIRAYLIDKGPPVQLHFRS